MKSYDWYCNKYPGSEQYLKDTEVLYWLNKLTEEQLYVDAVSMVNKAHSPLPELLFRHLHHRSFPKETGKYDRLRIKTLYDKVVNTRSSYYCAHERFKSLGIEHTVVDIGGNVEQYDKDHYYLIDDVSICRRESERNPGTRFIALRPSILEIGRHSRQLKDKLSSKPIDHLFIEDIEYLLYEEPDRRKYKLISNCLIDLISLFDIRESIHVALHRRAEDTIRVKILSKIANKACYWQGVKSVDMAFHKRQCGINSVILRIQKV